ncbi:MAG: hypothetical protein QNJ30_17710 [Kiloniellales bacterium]|nr:hypothetical protein [Kiloniellales bacterium]
MRDAPIVELGIREIATYCDFADLAYRSIDKSGRQEAVATYFYVHSLLSHCATVARLLWSSELAEHAGGSNIAALLKVPQDYRVEDDSVREIMDRYDTRLAHGLSLRGEVRKVLDFNIGDRDAFEEEYSLFLRHYDPTVDTLTLIEEEFNLAQIATELSDIKSRANAWLQDNASLEARPATPSVPPRH